MSDIIAFDKEAKKKILAGIALLAKSIKITLGVNPGNVVIRRKDGTVISTNDGAVVAEMIHFEDPFEQIGIDIVRKGGGGEPFTIVLTEAITRAGMKYIFDGGNPIEIKKGLESSLPLLLEALDNIAVPHQTDVGPLLFEGGYASPYFMTNRETMSCELEEPSIFITDKHLKSVYDVAPILEKQNNLLIIAEDIGEEALATLVVNCLNGGLKLAAIKTTKIKEIALLLGSELHVFGKVKKAIIGGDSTTIIRAGSNAIIDYIKVFPDLDLEILTNAIAELSPFLPRPLVFIKTALINAISTAGSLLTVETMVTKSKKKPPQ